MQTPQYIESLLQSTWLWFIARLCLAVVFIASGVAKLIDFQGGVAEMLAPGWSRRACSTSRWRR